MSLSTTTVHSFTFITVANMNSDRDPSVRRENIQCTNSSTNVDLAQQLLCLRDATGINYMISKGYRYQQHALREPCLGSYFKESGRF